MLSPIRTNQCVVVRNTSGASKNIPFHFDIVLCKSEYLYKEYRIMCSYFVEDEEPSFCRKAKA